MHFIIGLVVLTGILLAAILLTAGGIALVRREAANHHGSQLGTAMQELEGLFLESKRHVVHEQRAEESEEEAPAGDPPLK